MRSLQKTLTLWASGLMTDDEVVTWAGKRIAVLPEAPYELIELVTYGPSVCLKRAERDFPVRPISLSYEEAFALRAVATELEDSRLVATFARWASKHCMGEDLGHPFVRLGYLLDHLLEDCQDIPAASALVRAQLPSLLDSCKQIASAYAETEA